MSYIKTWSFSFNNYFSGSTAAEECAYTAWLWKALITGQTGSWSPTTPTTGFWTCVGSSDASAAGLDGVDRWGSTFTESKVVYSTGAHSWIVLRSPALAFNGYTVEVCLDLLNAIKGMAVLVVSLTSFTGGSTTARPTATNEVAQVPSFICSASTKAASRQHVGLTSEGSWYWLRNITGTGCSPVAMMCVAPVDVDTGDTWPVLSYKEYNSSYPNRVPAIPQISNASPNTNSPCYCRLANGVLGDTRTPWAGQKIALGGNLDYLSGKEIDLPVWLVAGNATHWHHRGRLPDMAHRPVGNGEAALATGNAIRESGNVVGFTCGSLILPGNAVPEFM